VFKVGPHYTYRTVLHSTPRDNEITCNQLTPMIVTVAQHTSSLGLPPPPPRAIKRMTKYTTQATNKWNDSSQ